MNNLISIIIPIYNSEQFLKELLDSILKQNYKNYEVLLINDGSTDNSESICLNYKKKDVRINYYYKKNSGVSDTRNYGISKANGDYVCFIDSDDILKSSYLTDFINEINKNPSQLICCDYIKFNNKNYNELNKFTDENDYIIYNEKYDVLFTNYGGYVWNKIFDLKIIKKNKIKFCKKISMCEDLIFVFQYLKYSNTVKCIKNKNYFSRASNNSLSKKLSNIKWFSIFEAYDYIIENKNLYNQLLFDKIIYLYKSHLLQGLYRLNFIKNNIEYKKIKNNIKKRLKEINSFKCRFSIKQRIKLFLYKYFNKISFYVKFKREKVLNNN